GQAADLLDDLDLLVARGGEDDVELVLLLGGSGTGLGTGTAGGRGGDGHGGGGLDVELLLKGLHELGKLDEGHLAELLKQLFLAELRHGGGPSLCAAVPCGVVGGLRHPRQSPGEQPAATKRRAALRLLGGFGLGGSRRTGTALLVLLGAKRVRGADQLRQR